MSKPNLTDREIDAAVGALWADLASRLDRKNIGNCDRVNAALDGDKYAACCTLVKMWRGQMMGADLSMSNSSSISKKIMMIKDADIREGFLNDFVAIRSKYRLLANEIAALDCKLQDEQEDIFEVKRWVYDSACKYSSVCKRLRLLDNGIGKTIERERPWWLRLF